MALTEAERIKCRVYTGRPASPRRDRFSTSSDGEIESAMDEINGNADRETGLREILTAITAIETEIGESQGFAMLAKAEEVSVDDKGFDKQRSNGMRECHRLALYLGIKVIGTPFGGARGYTGGPMRMG
jgi:hypothetical protein